MEAVHLHRRQDHIPGARAQRAGVIVEENAARSAVAEIDPALHAGGHRAFAGLAAGLVPVLLPVVGDRGKLEACGVGVAAELDAALHVVAELGDIGAHHRQVAFRQEQESAGAVAGGVFQLGFIGSQRAHIGQRHRRAL